MKLVFRNKTPMLQIDQAEKVWVDEAVTIFMEAGNDFQKSMAASLNVLLEHDAPWTLNQTYAFQGWLVALGSEFKLAIPQVMSETEALTLRFNEMRANSNRTNIA